MVAFFCRTPIHIFRSIQLRVQMLNDTKCDIYVFDTFPLSELIVRRLETMGSFNEVYYIRDEEYLKVGMGADFRTAVGKSSFKKLLMRTTYSQIFLFNVYGSFNDLIFNTLYKNNNRLIVNMIEDGPSIYHIETYDKGLFKKYIYPLTGLKDYLENITYWWFSEPDFMENITDSPKKKIPKVSRNDRKFVQEINTVFNYKGNTLIEDAEIIIMEECYWNDGLLKTNDDYSLFRQLSQLFSDRRITVKLHPRTRSNRFKDGFRVIEADGIPWEVYALNMDMNNKILVSMSCATMVSTKLLYGDETFSLLLYPIVEDKILCVDTMEKYLTEERKRKIDSQIELYKDREKFAKAESIDTACHILTNWLREIDEKKVE